jgi:hypothetical protein
MFVYFFWTASEEDEPVEDGGGGAEGPGEDGVAPTASLNGMRRSEKARVLEKA